MKKFLCFTFSVLLLFCSASCSNNSTAEEVNPLLDKIYMHNTPLEKTFDFDFVKFYDDNTFQGIKVSFKKNSATGENEHNNTSYYGTYSIENNSLTINISNDSFAGVIFDNGSSIKFGNDEFIDYTSNISETDHLLTEFK